MKMSICSPYCHDAAAISNRRSSARRSHQLQQSVRNNHPLSTSLKQEELVIGTQTFTNNLFSFRKNRQLALRCNFISRKHSATCILILPSSDAQVHCTSFDMIKNSIAPIAAKKLDRSSIKLLRERPAARHVGRRIVAGKSIWRKKMNDISISTSNCGVPVATVQEQMVKGGASLHQPTATKGHKCGVM